MDLFPLPPIGHIPLPLHRILKGPDNAREVRLLQEFRHNSFHEMLECFSFEGAYYAVFEHVPISLAHVTKSPPLVAPPHVNVAPLLLMLRLPWTFIAPLRTSFVALETTVPSWRCWFSCGS